jgi:hypothetical protein
MMEEVRVVVVVVVVVVEMGTAAEGDRAWGP